MKITLTLAEAENYIRLAQRLTIYDQVDIIVTSADLVVKSEADRANAGRVVSLIDAFLASNHKIDAIKEYRTYSNLGLKEARDVIEGWASARQAIENFGQLVKPKYEITLGGSRILGFVQCY